MSNTDPVIVGGRYQLGEMLGRGGMAEVRKGIDLRLGRPVAVKRLRTDLASDATFQARFRREAQASASLNHPSIVSVYDTGEESAVDGTNVNQPYIVMEYVAGRTLRDILREGRKILPERALEMTSGVLAALDYSHRAGIIHRDIKPGNVMLTPAGEVKVMDFGIARAIADVNSTMTQTAAVVGTAQYLSPEQARGETVDSRSDVYSAGCLLYELLTGRPPFVGDSPVSVAYQHVREHPAPPSDYDTSLTPEIDSIVMKALEKRVEDRYQSAAAMRNDIERYLAGHPVQAPPVMAAPAMEQPTAVTRAQQMLPTELEEPEEEETGGRWWWWVAGILALLGLIIGGYFASSYMFPDDPSTKVVVPNVVGETEDEALKILKDEGLEVDVKQRPNPDVEVGTVFKQDPGEGDEVDEGDTVKIFVSSGKKEVEIPEGLVGEDVDDVEQELEDLDLRVKTIEEASDAPAGEVLRIEPLEGTSVPIGSRVKVYYSAGPSEVLPDVVGLNEAQAIDELESLGWEVKVIKDFESEQPKGEVTKMDPVAGQPLEEGSVVRIWVSQFEQPTDPTTSPTTPSPPPEDNP